MHVTLAEGDCPQKSERVILGCLSVLQNGLDLGLKIIKQTNKQAKTKNKKISEVKKKGYILTKGQST